MASVKTPNTYCRNCGKHYYACVSCMRNQTWRSYCCSKECHEEYVKIILDEREAYAKQQSAKTSDLSNDELNRIKNLSPEEAKAETLNDLKEYYEENPDLSDAQILDKVNYDIQNKYKKHKKNR